jgi:hypothetical protein
MDLNHLLHREGVERLRAVAAACAAARDAHAGLADLYRDRIDFRRRAGPAPDPRAPQV